MRLVLLLTTIATSSALANPSVTLPRGVVTATLTTEINASEDLVGSPTSFAPDVAFGVVDDVTVSLVHSTFATTGFRGGAGLGICVADSCAHTYDNAGLEATYALTRGPLASGVSVGFYANSFDNRWTSAKLGGRVRATFGAVTVASNPSAFVALGGRDEMNRDRVFLPVSAMYRVARPVSVGLATGFKAALDDVGGSYEIAAGALFQYTFSPTWSAGASWVHGKIVGGDVTLPAGTSGLDYRAVHLWLTLTR